MKRTLRLTVLAAALASFVVVPSPAQAAAPSNDDFAHPTVMTSFPSTRTGTTLEATRATDDPECGIDASIWFSYTPRANRTILATTRGSGFATSVGAYVGTRGSLTEVACSNGGDANQTSVQIDVTAGTRYYFMVSANIDLGGRGTVQFSVQKPPTMSVSIARRGTVDQNGFVTVLSTFTCSDPGVIFFNPLGRQGERVSRDAEYFLSCPASAEPFELTVASEPANPLRPGRISIEFNAQFAGDDGGSANIVGTRIVCLRRITTPE